MKRYIHVNQHVLKKNKKTGAKDPPITVKTYKSNRYAQEVLIKGPCRLVYRPNDPLSCGARVYLVVEDGTEIELIGEET